MVGSCSRKPAAAAAVLLRVAVALGLFGAGCTVDADLSGMPCPCGDGWRCDPAQQICVPVEEGAPADWTGALTAVYLFEQPPPSLGADSSGHGLHLGARNLPEQSTTHVVQGTASLEVARAAQNGLDSTDAAFASPPGTSLTFGGWFRVAGQPPVYFSPIQRHESDGTNGVGYELLRDLPNGGLRCYISNGTADYAQVPSCWPIDEWVHAVCRFNNATDRIDAFVGGNLSGSLGKPDIESAPGPFSVPDSHNGFTGQMDELFFVDRSLSDDAIVRIWACGIDGSQCRCRTDQPSQYEHCGRAEPACSALIACDTPAP